MEGISDRRVAVSVHNSDSKLLPKAPKSTIDKDQHSNEALEKGIS